MKITVFRDFMKSIYKLRNVETRKEKSIDIQKIKEKS